MQIDQKEYLKIVTDISGWKTIHEAGEHGHLSRAQLYALYRDIRNQPHLEHTCRKIGRKTLINEKLLAMWLAGALPQQQSQHHAA